MRPALERHGEQFALVPDLGSDAPSRLYREVREIAAQTFWSTRGAFWQPCVRPRPAASEALFRHKPPGGSTGTVPRRPLLRRPARRGGLCPPGRPGLRRSALGRGPGTPPRARNPSPRRLALPRPNRRLYPLWTGNGPPAGRSPHPPLGHPRCPPAGAGPGGSGRHPGWAGATDRRGQPDRAGSALVGGRSCARAISPAPGEGLHTAPLSYRPGASAACRSPGPSGGDLSRRGPGLLSYPRHPCHGAFSGPGTGSRGDLHPSHPPCRGEAPGPCCRSGKRRPYHRGRRAEGRPRTGIRSGEPAAGDAHPLPPDASRSGAAAGGPAPGPIVLPRRRTVA